MLQNVIQPFTICYRTAPSAPSPFWWYFSKHLYEKCIIIKSIIPYFDRMVVFHKSLHI